MVEINCNPQTSCLAWTILMQINCTSTVCCVQDLVEVREAITRLLVYSWGWTEQLSPTVCTFCPEVMRPMSFDRPIVPDEEPGLCQKCAGDYNWCINEVLVWYGKTTKHVTCFVCVRVLFFFLRFSRSQRSSTLTWTHCCGLTDRQVSPLLAAMCVCVCVSLSLSPPHPPPPFLCGCLTL